MRRISLVLLFTVAILAAKATQPIRVVCVGNSITSGIGCTSEEAAWPAQANKLLGTGYLFSNCGVSGTTMFKHSNYPYWSTSRFKLARTLNPQILIISLGTNDSSPKRWNTLKGEFKSDYLEMVKEFRQEGKDPVIYVCLPPPLFGPEKTEHNAIVENELIPLIKEIAGEIGAHVIDFHHPLLNEGKQFPDNTHPNDAGALLMAQIVYNCIKNAPTTKP